MDPDATLKEIEDILNSAPTTLQIKEDDALRMEELVAALDEWRRKGGRNPDWDKCPKATTYFFSM